MQNTARRQAIRPLVRPPKTPSKKRRAKPGRDGKTLGERLELAMTYEAGRRGREYRQADLLHDLNRLAGATDEEPVITQQMLSAVMLNKVTRSSFTSLMASACHVNALWLAEGIGKMTD